MSSTYLGSHESEAEAASAILRTTTAIRERAGQLLARARRGESSWFTVDDGALDTTAAAVADATRRRYPKLHVPLHSRWREFEAGNIDRQARLLQLLEPLPHIARAHALVDLTIASVLLDGGAGPDWKYTEAATGLAFTGSEALAVASWYAFAGGMFSSDANRPLQVDADGLRGLITDRLAAAFQVSETNPLPGLAERAVLLRRLGEVMLEEPQLFGDAGRPCGIFDVIASPFGAAVSPTATASAHDILSQILYGLSGIWPNTNSIEGVPLGDCWRHAAVRGEGLSDGWMPLHQLSQWMAYSLIEPFEYAGVRVHHIDQLTALADAPHAGLLLDTGLLRLRDEASAQPLWQPADEIVVEWRALTVALMDEVADAVRRKLNLSRERLPLACVLQGGSSAVGRELGQRRRGGLPPLKVAGEGKVL